jgi:hypothetical protein
MVDLLDHTHATSPIDEHFFCGACRNIVDEPKKCSHCEILICDSCIKQLLKKDSKTKTGNTCPHCKSKPFKDVNLSRYERLKLNEVEFKCNRCECNFIYEDRVKHLQTCKSLEGLCPTQCEVTGIKT